MSSLSTSSPASARLSLQEMSKAAEYLDATRDGVLQAVAGLSETQWKFKPAPGAWSIAEILEHLTIIESRIHAIIGRMPEEALAEPGRINSEVDEMILAQIPSRSAKIAAPAPLCPLQESSPQDFLARFLDSRARTVDLLLQSPCLRGHLVPHPILGPWDGYQWILAAGAHCARHTAQMLEVKLSPAFPEARPASPVPLA